MAKPRRPKRKSTAKLTMVSAQEPDTGELVEFLDQLEAAGAPAEVLRVLDGVTDADEAVRRLAEAGVLPYPADALGGLLRGWEATLAPGSESLSAELCGAEFLGMLRRAAPDESELPEMLADLIAQAAESGRPAALAMLRVVAMIGPPQVRQAAADSADHMVAAGLTDPPWVPGLGAPKVGRCFGYADGIGGQEAVAITFSYGRKRHAFVVLLDHALGGGVKDCFVTDRPDRIRAQYQRAAGSNGLELYDYSPTATRELLDRALDRDPCPVAPDQVEDVGDYLELLRQRAALLPDGTSQAARARTVPTVHRVKITLRGAKPPIWRRLEVPSGTTLERLHHVIQEAFGWEDCHLWVFSTPRGEYGVADRELGHQSAAARKLADVAGSAGDRVHYTYDFGDSWEHDLLVEDIVPAEAGVAYPRCLTGRRACPPEDCGGIGGYQDLLAILDAPGHPEHADRLEWLGLNTAAEFAPARFDPDEMGKRLSRLARVLLKGSKDR